MTREKTEEEVRNEFVEHVRQMAEYWNSVGETKKDALDGLAFSILVAIDGDSVALPSFILAPNPHPEDKEFLLSRGEEYYPENHQNNISCNISGSLHDMYYK